MRSEAEIFRENIKSICKARGLTMKSVTKKAGYSHQHLASLEYYNSGITIAAIKNYAKALGVSPFELMEGMFDEEVRGE